MVQVESIRNMLAEELAKWDQSSIAVGIIKDGEIILNEGFGYADAPAKRLANADTMYHIGSCSKAFTAAAVGVLVDQGKLSWDVPVKKYLPWIDGPVTCKGMVENLRNMQPLWSMRSQWCYQNTCFVAAGILVEAISGMSWEDFVSKYILKPLGMDRTTFYVDAIRGDANHAEPHARVMPMDTNGYHVIPFLMSDREDMAAGIGAPYGPAGSIISTVNDMLKWLAMNLNKGKFGDKQAELLTLISGAVDEESAHTAMQAVVNQLGYVPVFYTAHYFAYDADLNLGDFYVTSGGFFFHEFSWNN